MSWSESIFGDPYCPLAIGRRARQAGAERASCPFFEPEAAEAWRHGWDVEDKHVKRTKGEPTPEERVLNCLLVAVLFIAVLVLILAVAVLWPAPAPMNSKTIPSPAPDRSR